MLLKSITSLDLFFFLLTNKPISCLITSDVNYKCRVSHPNEETKKKKETGLPVYQLIAKTNFGILPPPWLSLLQSPELKLNPAFNNYVPRGLPEGMAHQ